MGVGEVITSKGIISVLMTFTQAALLMLIIGGFRQQPLIIAVTLLLGALLVTGIGFLMGAVGKDFLSVIGSGIPAIILLSIPAMGIAFPGLLTGWARMIPVPLPGRHHPPGGNFGALGPGLAEFVDLAGCGRGSFMAGWVRAQRKFR
jgi:hypothetical protein